MTMLVMVMNMMIEMCSREHVIGIHYNDDDSDYCSEYPMITKTGQIMELIMIQIIKIILM